MSKTRVLAWGDYACSTGFGTVMKNIMGNLYSTDNYDLDIVGVNYDGGPYDTAKWPGTLWPAISALRTQGPYGDVFGRQVFLDLLFSVITILYSLSKIRLFCSPSFHRFKSYSAPRLKLSQLFITTHLTVHHVRNGSHSALQLLTSPQRILNTLRMKAVKFWVSSRTSKTSCTMERIPTTSSQ